jgi:Ankyrin repeats (3 copies)
MKHLVSFLIISYSFHFSAKINVFSHLEFHACFQTPLHLAVLTQQHHIVRALLVAGASPDSRDRHGNTALHLASDQGLTKCVHALLQPVTVEETSNSGLVFTVPRYISKPALLEELNYDGEYPPAAF